eukprot:scaffold4002_cov123-Isochrysis_galbana.AAC.11
MPIIWCNPHLLAPVPSQSARSPLWLFTAPDRGLSRLRRLCYELRRGSEQQNHAHTYTNRCCRMGGR